MLYLRLPLPTKVNFFFRLQLEDFEGKDEVVNVPPEEVVAEKQTLLSKLHSFEKKEEHVEKKVQIVIPEKKIQVMEPPKSPPKKVEVSFFY